MWTRRKQHGLELLIVDDSVAACYRLEELLNGLRNLSISSANTIADAEEIMQQACPAIILVDLQLNGSYTGFQLMKTIGVQCPEAVVIVVSNHNQPAHREKSFALGAQLFIDKTTEFHRLPNIIDAIMMVTSTEL